MTTSSSRGDNTDEVSATKPCRACTDFKSWMKKQMNKRDATYKIENPNKTSLTTNPDVIEKSLGDCPLDKIDLGINTWSFLHTMAAYYPEKPTFSEQNDMKSFINLFSKFYPCDYCAEDLREDLKNHQPDVTSNINLSRWFCNLHNRINVKLGKPEFDCNTVMYRWKDGWPDGKCN